MGLVFAFYPISYGYGENAINIPRTPQPEPIGGIDRRDPISLIIDLIVTILLYSNWTQNSLKMVQINFNT